MAVSTALEVIYPIEGFDIEVSPAHVGLNEPVNVAVHMTRGSEVVLEWQWGDGSSPLTLPDAGIQLKSHQSDSIAFSDQSSM